MTEPRDRDRAFRDSKLARVAGNIASGIAQRPDANPWDPDARASIARAAVDVALTILALIESEA